MFTPSKLKASLSPPGWPSSCSDSGPALPTLPAFLTALSCSQTKRGGGGVVIQDEGMWQALTSLVTELEGSGPQVASAQLPLCFTQQATLSVQTPMQPARRPRQRTGAFAASGSGMAALTQGVGSSLHAIGGRPMSTAVGMSAGSEGARARSTGDVVDGDISSSTGGGMRELDKGQVQFSDASRAEASDGSRGEVVVPVDGSQSTASSASGNGVAPARASGGSTCAAGDAGNGAEPALSSNGTNKAAGDAASTGADGSSSAAKRCSCRPENCGKGRCSCKAHTCSQLCGCKGLCAFTVQALQAAQHANAAAVLAPGQAPGEDAAAAAAAAVCLLPAEGEASPLRAAVAAAELSAGVPTTPEPERATPPAVAVESAEPLRVAAVAAGLGNLMQSAAMASALSAAAPAAHLLHDHQAADSKQGHKDGGAGGANSGSAAGSGAIAADSAVGASPGAAKACKCSPGNCGRGRCSCKGGSHRCSERCKCRGLCRYTAELPAVNCEAVYAVVGAADAPAAGATETAGADATDHTPPPPPAPVAALADALQRLVHTAGVAAAVVASRLPRPEGGSPSPVSSAEPLAAAAELAGGEGQQPAAQGSNGGGGGAGQREDGSGTLSEAGHQVCCGCAGGCHDRRCRCRRAGLACGAHCECSGCANCG